MSFPKADGQPDYSSGGASKFIPAIYSGKLVEKFYTATVFSEISNTDYEGEITQAGDKVIIRTIPSITINNYVKGAGLTYEQPTSANVELNIDQGKAWAYELKDVDKAQSDLDLMNKWTDDAGEQLKIAVDSDILAAIPSDADANNSGATAGKISGNINLGTTANPLALSKDNILDALVDFGTVLDEQNVPESNRFVVMPARMCGLIKKSDLKDASLAGDNTSILRNGRLGMIDRFMLYSSNNVAVASGKHDVVFGHQSAMTFAGQVTQTETLKNQNDFGDLVRGLFVFGFEVIKPESLGHAVITFA